MSEPEERVFTGWQGRFLEDFRVGDVYRHSHGRTITQTGWLCTTVHPSRGA